MNSIKLWFMNNIKLWFMKNMIGKNKSITSLFILITYKFLYKIVFYLKLCSIQYFIIWIINMIHYYAISKITCYSQYQDKTACSFRPRILLTQDSIRYTLETDLQSQTDYNLGRSLLEILRFRRCWYNWKWNTLKNLFYCFWRPKLNLELIVAWLILERFLRY